MFQFFRLKRFLKNVLFFQVTHQFQAGNEKPIIVDVVDDLDEYEADAAPFHEKPRVNSVFARLNPSTASRNRLNVSDQRSPDLPDQEEDTNSSPRTPRQPKHVWPNASLTPTFLQQLMRRDEEPGETRTEHRHTSVKAEQTYASSFQPHAAAMAAESPVQRKPAVTSFKVKF